MTLDPLFRKAQFEILNYQRGLMGVAAVPGSGKTYTLAHLAARLIQQLAQRRDADQVEVLIVTFTNVAVNSFKSRLSGILNQRRIILPYSGYRIRTLHGLASDIIRERPSLAGLSEDFVILDEREARGMRADLVRHWWEGHQAEFIKSYVDERQWQNRKLLDDDLPNYVADIAERFIRLAKDRELTPAALRTDLQATGLDLPLARFGLEIYEGYQRNLDQRGAVDFDDLSMRALAALRGNKSFLRRLQRRWPYILEDEAQDSSKLQEELLRLLSAGKNWVRVGDPNQAINTTFTTANPQFLNEYLAEEQVTEYTLAEAGRSSTPIIALANELARWVTHEHPALELRSALAFQAIQPTQPGDRQPNPPIEATVIEVRMEPGKEVSSEVELKQVVESLGAWLPEHPDRTVAVLVPDNKRGFRLVELLRQLGIDYEELLSSTTTTRAAADQLYTVLAYLAAPISNKFGVTLASLYQKVWWPLHLGRLDETPEDLLKRALTVLSDVQNVEAFLWPEADGEQPESALIGTLQGQSAALGADVETFRDHLQRWLDALILPIDQLVLIVNQDLFSEPGDIALGYKFAGLLRSAARNHPTWRLDEFVEELKAISTNERRYLGLEALDLGYKPREGRVTVSTMHQAKGLEWDRVYVTGLSNYVFPSLQPNDKYQDEKYYIRDGLNLRAETFAQLDALLQGNVYREGDVTRQARIELCAERLRLFYVTITRARREVILSWNSGRFAQSSKTSVNRPALPLVALAESLKAAGRAIENPGEDR